MGDDAFRSRILKKSGRETSEISGQKFLPGKQAADDLGGRDDEGRLRSRFESASPSDNLYEYCQPDLRAILGQ